MRTGLTAGGGAAITRCQIQLTRYPGGAGEG